MTSGVLLSAKNISKTYSQGDNLVHALRDVSFEIKPGEFVALVGASGSGKSTLLNIIGLTDVPSSGELFLEGTLLRFKNESQLIQLRRSRLGYIFQYFNLLPHLSALENVMLPLMLNSCAIGEATERASDILRSLGLASRLTHRPNQLSGGEMQRVALARALVHRPALILADEPTGNLDSQSGEKVLTLLRECSERGTGVLMATHSERAIKYCVRCLRLEDGRLIS